MTIAQSSGGRPNRNLVSLFRLRASHRRRSYSMKQIVAALLFSGVLLSTAVAKDDDDHRNRERVYRDRDRHDEHRWNERESRAWREYLERERHRQYYEFDRAKTREQRDYWRWRHAHPEYDR